MLQVCPLTALARGEAHRVDSSPPIAVFHTDDGELFAIDDTCTHQDASLADGWLEGDEIECPLHASRFSLRTGHAPTLPGQTARSYPRGRRGWRRVINVIPSQASPNLPPGL